MSGLKMFYLPLLMAALLAGCGDGKKDAESKEKGPTQVAAKVNDTELTVHQINFALQRIPNLDKSQTQAASLQVIRNLVDQEVLVQKAVKDKLDRDPVVIQALDASRRQILAEAYMGRKLGTLEEPGEAAVLDYFNTHPELFSKRKVYRLQEISIKAPKDKRDAIREKLATSKSLNDFAAWLKAENFPAKAAQAVKPAEQLPLEILPRLAAMKDGQGMLVDAPDGLLVIVMADSQSQPVTLEQARPVIVRVLQTQARQKAAKAEIDSLKAAAKIVYLGDYADAGKVSPAAAPAPAASEPPAASTADATPAADAEAISKGMSGLK
jgi:EpsD family peptidyl-prolyl cis-trans isomerase